MTRQILFARAKRFVRHLFQHKAISIKRFNMPGVNPGYYVLAGVGGYILTSIFFLKCPIIYKKKRLLFKCSHISHRGGAAEKLENTCNAYRNAMECGTQMLELDVHLTADKVVVVSHDNHLLRTTGEDVHIKDTKYEDLPLLSKELGVTFHYHTTCHHEGNALQIEKLEDVFQEFPNTPIHLDVKIYDEELIQETNNLIRKFNREEITPWGNFSNKVTSKLYKTNPNIPLVFSMKRVALTVLTFYLGLLPFLPIKESCFAVIMPNIARKAFNPSMTESCGIRALFAVIDFLLMSNVLFTHLKDRGINVYLWVLNDEEDFKRAYKKLGVTGVMTDFPSKLNDWLKEHPQYRSDD
ncbi:lysophospholipase D GDPD1-like [Styela clava]